MIEEHYYAPYNGSYMLLVKLQMESFFVASAVCNPKICLYKKKIYQMCSRVDMQMNIDPL